MVSEVDRAEERRFEMSELTEREKQVDAIRRREEAALDFRAAHEDREPRDDQELSEWCRAVARARPWPPEPA